MVELTSLTMLRHPLEVAKSRETAYLEGKEEELRRIRAIANIAGWCNAAFETEGVTRAGRRSFVLYSDLVSDWRSAVRPVPDHLGVTFDSDPEQRPHPVDDFVDSQLYRSKVSWEDTDVSPALRDVAEATWQAMNRSSSSLPMTRPQPPSSRDCGHATSRCTTRRSRSRTTTRGGGWRTSATRSAATESARPTPSERALTAPRPASARSRHRPTGEVSGAWRAWGARRARRALRRRR